MRLGKYIECDWRIGRIEFSIRVFSLYKSDGRYGHKLCFLDLSGRRGCGLRVMTRIVSSQYSIPIGGSNLKLFFFFDNNLKLLYHWEIVV